MIRINLLPVRTFRRKENIRMQVSIFILTIVFMIVVMTGVYLWKNREATELAGKKTDLTDQVAKLQDKVKDAEGLKKEEALLEDRIKIIFELEANRRGPTLVLEQVSKRIPQNKAWLDGLDTDKNKLNLKGKAIDNETVAEFMANLGGITGTVSENPDSGEKKSYNIFKDVELVRSAQEMAKELRLKSFQITCAISLPEEQAAAEQAAAEKNKKDPQKDKK
ncbi:MAG: PilN domain-containing protein [Deltaproteobacteria bacterium]|nr:PilN domain-containing protein [Deltaproteobacteria bacterium]